MHGQPGFAVGQTIKAFEIALTDLRACTPPEVRLSSDPAHYEQDADTVELWSPGNPALIQFDGGWANKNYEVKLTCIR